MDWSMSWSIDQVTTVRPLLSSHPWPLNRWPLNRGTKFIVKKHQGHFKPTHSSSSNTKGTLLKCLKCTIFLRVANVQKNIQNIVDKFLTVSMLSVITLYHLSPFRLKR